MKNKKTIGVKTGYVKKVNMKKKDIVLTKKKKKPTLKQKEAFKNVIENRGNVSKGMRDAGYTEATAKNPKNLTESKSWTDLVEEYLPDILLAKTHKELLTVPRKIRTFLKGDLQTEIEEVDSAAISRGLDMAYKLKNKYAATKIKFEDENKDLTDEEVEDRLAEIRRRREDLLEKSNAKRKAKSA